MHCVTSDDTAWPWDIRQVSSQMVKQFGYGETNAVMVRSTELVIPWLPHAAMQQLLSADGFNMFQLAVHSNFSHL